MAGDNTKQETQFPKVTPNDVNRAIDQGIIDPNSAGYITKDDSTIENPAGVYGPKTQRPSATNPKQPGQK